jgi:hypothetical protein
MKKFPYFPRTVMRTLVIDGQPIDVVVKKGVEEVFLHRAGEKAPFSKITQRLKARVAQQLLDLVRNDSDEVSA